MLGHRKPGHSSLLAGRSSVVFQLLDEFENHGNKVTPKSMTESQDRMKVRDHFKILYLIRMYFEIHFGLAIYHIKLSYNNKRGGQGTLRARSEARK